MYVCMYSHGIKSTSHGYRSDYIDAWRMYGATPHHYHRTCSGHTPMHLSSPWEPCVIADQRPKPAIEYPVIQFALDAVPMKGPGTLGAQVTFTRAMTIYRISHLQGMIPVPACLHFPTRGPCDLYHSRKGSQGTRMTGNKEGTAGVAREGKGQKSSGTLRFSVRR